MKTINCHMHLLNFEYIPDRFFKAQAKIPEWIVRIKVVRQVVYGAIKLFRLKGLYHSYFITDIFTKNMSLVVQAYLEEMDKADILIATPLMMDISYDCHKKGEISLNQQISEVSKLCRETKGRLIPFISVDPRRVDAYEIIVNGLENHGFLGVKLYPPLGYNINPYDIYNMEHGYSERLHRIYSYCEINCIPITTHCSKGGAYSEKLTKEKEFCDYLSRPSHIGQILWNYPNLIINLAHLGGDLYSFEQEDNWSKEVLTLAKKYKNVFCDVCCQGQSFEDDNVGEFKQTIRRALDHRVLSNKIIFGTDWPISGIRYSEEEYKNEMIKVLGANYNKVLTANPLKFLFSNGKVPKRILDYYKNSNITMDSRILKLIEGD